jgi:hypothetical protein
MDSTHTEKYGDTHTHWQHGDPVSPPKQIVGGGSNRQGYTHTHTHTHTQETDHISLLLFFHNNVG